MDVGVVGINHKQANLRLRERIAKVCLEHFGDHGDLPHVLLSTCNRTEIYFSAPNLSSIHRRILCELRESLSEAALQGLYSFFGRDCLSHLARVTSGLDSAIIGESEIQGQVKQAYESARQQPLSSEMHFLFQKCLRIGKKVRTHFHFKPGMPDTESTILDVMRKLFGDVRRCRVLFVGASEINDKVLNRFQARGIQATTLCNRTHDRAVLFAKEKRVAIRPWGHVSKWHTYDAVIFATKSPDYLLAPQDMPSRLTAPKLLVDLAVPRNVDPTLDRHPAITLVNIEKIHRLVEKRRKLTTSVLTDVEANVALEVDRHLTSFQRRELRFA